MEHVEHFGERQLTQVMLPVSNTSQDNDQNKQKRSLLWPGHMHHCHRVYIYKYALDRRYAHMLI